MLGLGAVLPGCSYTVLRSSAARDFPACRLRACKSVVHIGPWAWAMDGVCFAAWVAPNDVVLC
jgi:hypothetical protein